MNKTLNLRISSSWWSAIKRLSEKHHRSLNAEILTAIEEYVDKRANELDLTVTQRTKLRNHE